MFYEKPLELRVFQVGYVELVVYTFHELQGLCHRPSNGLVDGCF